MAGAGGVNLEKFEEYFQRADVDRDGKISGAEAVNFLLGSNLPRQVLAQIWAHVDQNKIGFLNRPEFYNALKLVTVAQSKRELTADIVKAALFGPASSKIPPPQINTAGAPVLPPNTVAATPVPPPLPQVGANAQPSPQSFGLRGPSPSITGVNPQFGNMPSTTGMNQQFRPIPSSTGMNQQFRPMPSSTGMNQQFGQQLQPSNTNMNQQFGQPSQPSSTNMNQQFGQTLQPSSTNTNQQFVHLQPSSTNMNQQFFPSQVNQMRPPQSMPTGIASRPPQAAMTTTNISGGPGLQNPNDDWLGGRSVSAPTGPVTQVLNRGASPSISPVAPNPQDPFSTFSSTAVKNTKGLVSSGNGPATNSMITGDVFSTNQFPSQKVSSAPQQPMSSLPTSSAIVPVASSPQPSAKPDPFEVFGSTLMKPSSGVQVAQTPSLPKSTQQAPTPTSSSVLSAGVQTGVGNSVSEPPQVAWPKMTRAGIQKYAKVFVEVDTDRDGKITGVQARNLFLSWKLPLEVLKQVWDLSDQDSDSMLSLREFCIALYLMERYREGRQLPPSLPNSVMLDETLLSLAGPPSAYGNTGWGQSTGLRPPQGLHGAQPVTPVGLRPPLQPIVYQADGSMQFNQNNGRGPMIENSHPSQVSNGEENSLEVEGREAAGTNEKVDNKEKEILDSREKLEFYRTKMQDLVLYKSRCDNRLNEITERARADKTEAELLEKKYQEKYKQVAEVHSKLTIEEASFREVQERKMELHQAIIKMEQGGSADGILQVRADRIQSDLEDLLKGLTDRCKKHDLEMKSAAMIELPPGNFCNSWPFLHLILPTHWPIQSCDFILLRLLCLTPLHVNSLRDLFLERYPPLRLKNLHLMNYTTLGFIPINKKEKVSTTILIQKFLFHLFLLFFNILFPLLCRSFDEPSWGNYDNNDDVDSVWGFNAKDSDHTKHEDKYFYESHNDFGASPEISGSPHTKNSPYTFEESIPGTPLSRAEEYSPRNSIESRDHLFDNSFSRFDSFSANDGGSQPYRESNLTRFDSMSSTSGFGHSSNYSFDDSDPFGSTGPFKVSSENQEKKF
ncbi:PREDICTED: actin cytoskeleton-regulatory complex protein PAN1 [Erythranthe guttata]|uniref:actin cytoskeleton-regulatory complex protein PAN1 n=1 Tax=Erythranthe guttata TaxID=4155 RepID=UPI00064D98D3|nr:PREDICTED: actin cytoskeleton-regulatory complex protein PAN1 [Erythranthe guttata]|eukprot:XP_012829934.1 PREDICTED: actin cytoskeleton-regulatory complex protein PAN1 [Erythranthe guttata]